MPPKNDRLLRALRRQDVDCAPVWIMRQAGRYLPEYRQTRARAGDFMTLCKTPALACEVTLQPLRRFDLDAAILFSDILTIPDAMGLGLSFTDGVGPRFARRVQTKTDIDNLPAVDMDDLRYVFDAVALTRRALNAMDDGVPLIGFSGRPVDFGRVYGRRRRQQRLPPRARAAARRRTKRASVAGEISARGGRLSRRAGPRRRAGVDDF